MTQRVKAFALRWIGLSMLFFMCAALLPICAAYAEEERVLSQAMTADFGERHGVAAVDGAVYAWGRNAYGQLGTGTISDVSTAPQLISYRVFQERVQQVAAGENHCVALTEGGRVFAWGDNSNGQAASVNGNVLIPTEVGEDIFSVDAAVKIDANYSNTIVITAGHEVYACGNNLYGQLGNTDGNSAAFIKLTGYEGTAQDVAVGNGYVVVMTETGVYVMGDGQYGQFGNGTQTGEAAQFYKVNLPEGSTAAAVVCGNKHMLAKMTDGTVYGWGSNAYKQLGVDERYVTEPVRLPVENVKQIAAYAYGCAMLDDAGAVSIFGSNERGEWGIGERRFTSNKNGTKLENIEGAAISSIGVGRNNIAVRTENGKVYTWGANMYYQSGISSAANDDYVLLPTYMKVPLNDIPYGVGSTLELRVNDQPITEELVLDAGSIFTIDVYISGVKKADAFVLPLKFDPQKMILTNSEGQVLPGGTITECSERTGFSSYNESLILQNGYPFVNNSSGLIKLMGRNTTGNEGMEEPTKICSMTFRGLGRTTAKLEIATKENGAVYDYLYPEGPCFGLNDGSNFMAVHWDFENVRAQEIQYQYIDMEDFSFQLTHGEEVQQDVSELKLEFNNHDTYIIAAVPNPENASDPGFIWKTPVTNTKNDWSDYITIEQSERSAEIRVKDALSEPVKIQFPVQANGREGTIEKIFTVSITKPLPESVVITKPEDMPEILTDLNQTYTLTGTVLPDKEGINKTILWKVSDETKLQLTPNADGSSCTIRPLDSAGEEVIKITASAQDDDTILAEIEIKIQIAIDSFSIKGEDVVLLEVGKAQTLETEVLPKVAYVKGDVMWSTWLLQDSDYIDVNDKTGEVTAKPDSEGKEVKVRAVLVQDKGLPTQKITQGAVKNIKIVSADAKLFYADIELVNKKDAPDLIKITLTDESVKIGDVVCIYTDKDQDQPVATIPVTSQTTEAELAEDILRKDGGQILVSVRDGETETDKMPVTYESEKGLIYGTVARWGRSEQANAGVTVTLNGTKTTVTDPKGYFCFEDCEPGEYTITLTSPNYYTRTEIRCTLREDEGIEVSSSTSKLDIYPGDFDGAGGITISDTDFYLKNYVGTAQNSKMYQGEDGQALFDAVNFYDEPGATIEYININDLYVMLQCEGKKYNDWVIQ